MPLSLIGVEELATSSRLHMMHVRGRESRVEMVAVAELRLAKCNVVAVRRCVTDARLRQILDGFEYLSYGTIKSVSSIKCQLLKSYIADSIRGTVHLKSHLN